MNTFEILLLVHGVIVLLILIKTIDVNVKHHQGKITDQFFEKTINSLAGFIVGLSLGLMSMLVLYHS